MPDRAPIPGPIGLALERLYARAVLRRNLRFDLGRGVVRLDRLVFSVGNLSVGGTGKTPIVRHLVHALLRRGRRPCVAMRGYRSAGAGADEPGEYAASLPGIPLVVRPDRVEGLLELFAAHEREGATPVDTVVLDDAFQHRRLSRDLDLVLVDATRGTLDDRLLPAGLLREPFESIARAHAVIVTRADLAPPEAAQRVFARARALRPDIVLAACAHVWDSIDVVADGRTHAEPLSFLRSRRVGLVCAIGNPGAFVAQARRAIGGEPAFALVLRDHDPYGARTRRRLERLAREHATDLVLTTPKDWTKLARTPWPFPVARPRLSIAFSRGEADLDDLIDRTIARGVPD